MAEKRETWRNGSKSTFYIRVLGPDGRPDVKPIVGLRTFHVTPEERRMNSLETAVAANDPFHNGTFTALEVIDDDVDAERIKNNPNNLGDSELSALLAGPFGELDSRLATITNPILVRRLLELAEDPAKEISAAKVAAVKTRLSAVSGRPPGNEERHAETKPAPSAGVPEPQEASFYSDFKPDAQVE